MRASRECDVLVVGGGGSGLAAAIEAGSDGARVVLLEKNRSPGGTTALSVGSITATGTPHQLRQGIVDSAVEHATDLAKINTRRAAPDNPELRRILTENVPDTFRWLLSLGVDFIGPLPEPPHSQARMHCVVPTAKAYVAQLTKRARALGVEFLCGMTARRLATRDGCVAGVDCTDASGNPAAVRARAVVLATGDFSGNASMVEHFVSPEATHAIPVNRTNTGDGHRMALELGARVVNGNIALVSIRFPPPKRKTFLQLIPPSPLLARAMRIAYDRLPEAIVRPFVMSFITSVLQPSKAIYQAGAILVNREGRRFGDETGDLALALARQPGGCAYVLFDARIAKQFSRWPNFVSTAPGTGYAYVADYRRHRRDLWHRAANIRALAKSIGVPYDALSETVAASRVRASDDERPHLVEAPFYALGPLNAVLVFTDGGLAVDCDLRVLDSGDEPIEGLFAAGSVGQGGMLLEGHGHHIGWAFTSGRIAGRNALAFARQK